MCDRNVIESISYNK